MCSAAVTTAMVDQCDVLKQDCPPGQWCDIVQGKTTCVGDAGGVKCKGDPCTADGECQAGLKCINNRCSPFCCSATDEPCDAGLCLLEFDYGSSITARFCAYPPQCELLQDNCPEMGLNCYPLKLPEAFAGCFPQAIPAVDEGEPCMFLNDCGESSFCYEDPNDPNDMSMCRQLCDETNWMTQMVPTGGCPPSRTCVDVNWGNMEWNNIGICLPDGRRRRRQRVPQRHLDDASERRRALDLVGQHPQDVEPARHVG
jgi:hypothetical protein